MPGPLLALAASLSWGLGDFLAGLRTRRLAVVTVLVVSQAAGLTTIALVVAVRAAGPPENRYLGYAALAGVAGAVGLASARRPGRTSRNDRPNGLYRLDAARPIIGAHGLRDALDRRPPARRLG
ncbi:MAG: hypothetical protein ACRDNG_09275, partial [Gaiellaceae bacterium]